MEFNMVTASDHPPIPNPPIPQSPNPPIPQSPNPPIPQSPNPPIPFTQYYPGEVSD